MEAKRLSYKEADLFQYYLEELPQVTKAVVYERTADAVICYQGERSTLLKKVAAYRCKDVKVPDGILEHSGRELNSQYQEKLVNKVLFHYGRKVFLPAPIAAAYTGFCSINTSGREFRHLQKARSKFRYWMEQPSEFLYCVVTRRPQVRSCSCLASENC